VIRHDFTYLSLQNLPSFISVCLHFWPNLNSKENYDNTNNIKKHNKQNESKKTVNLPTVLNCFFFPIFIHFFFSFSSISVVKIVTIFLILFVGAWLGLLMGRLVDFPAY